MSWQDARAYIAWLNRKAHRGGAAPANGPYRLPSEAEWEYAARAGTTTKFYWGDDDAAAPVHAWFNANSGCENVSGLFCDHGQTHPVGAKPPNAFGLYDMAGNVWQWTEDCYDNSYDGIPADGRANEAPSSDPKAKDGQGNCLRVDRGSSWMFPAWLLRPATRERNPADYRDAIMGFRLAKTLQGKESPTLINTPQAQKSEPPPTARIVELKAPDGTILKASYFAAAKPGPGVLLFHQSNRTRKDWDDVAAQLAAAGINTLTFDDRGHGESGGKYDEWTEPNKEQAKQQWPGDLDTAFQYLVSQSGVKRDVIGLGGAGLLGVNSSVQAARRHPAEVKSLALLSGETFRDGLQFLRESSQLPGLFVVADDDEYPPTVEAMELLYITSSSTAKKFVHYSATQEAPWLWYEPVDIGKVPANGGHGTDMFKPHPELPGIIVGWFVTTLIKTPGHAPADTLASAPIINKIRTPGGVAQVTQQLTEARRKDPKAQLFPEITVGIIGADHMRAGDMKSAIEVMKLVVLAYPESADAHSNLADAYLRDRQKDLAREHAEKTLALLDSHTTPASSWSDTEENRGEIRRGAQETLKKLDEKQQ